MRVLAGCGLLRVMVCGTWLHVLPNVLVKESAIARLYIEWVGYSMYILSRLDD